MPCFYFRWYTYILLLAYAYVVVATFIAGMILENIKLPLGSEVSHLSVIHIGSIFEYHNDWLLFLYYRLSWFLLMLAVESNSFDYGGT